MLGTDGGECVVCVGPPVAVGVSASESVVGGGARTSRTRIALEAVGVVAVAVFVDIGPLGAVNGECVRCVAVAVLVAVCTAEHAPKGTGSGDLRAVVLAVIESVVIVVRVLARILASVPVGIVTARRGESERARGAEVFLCRRNGARPEHIGGGAVADAVVVVVDVLVCILTTVAVVIAQGIGSPGHGTRWARIGKVEHPVVIVVAVFDGISATVAVVVRLKRGCPSKIASYAGVIGVKHAVVIVVSVAGIAEPVRIEVKLRGVGHHGAVVVIVANAVAVLVGERVDANDLILAVVHVVEVAVRAEFKAHDGGSGGLNFIDVGAALSVRRKVVGATMLPLLYSDTNSWSS